MFVPNLSLLHGLSEIVKIELKLCCLLNVSCGRYEGSSKRT